MGYSSARFLCKNPLLIELKQGLQKMAQYRTKNQPTIAIWVSGNVIIPSIVVSTWIPVKFTLLGLMTGLIITIKYGNQISTTE